MRYEIEENTNAVRVWNDEEEAPFLFQPTWPDNTSFANAKEAEKFAKAVIAHHADPEANAFPVTKDDLK
jgi:hypothetical protein